MLGGVSIEGGLEGWLTRPRSIDGAAFIAFLSNLLEGREASKLVIFMDNATIHNSKVVKAFMAERGLAGIFNVAYSPQYNPIEIVWSQVKAGFKKAKLELLAQGVAINYDRLAIQSLLSVDPSKISSICRKVLDREILQLNT